MKATRRRCIGAMLTLLVLGASLAFTGGKSEAQTLCPRGAIPHIVVYGDTLSKIASLYRVNWRSLAFENRLANPNLIHQGQIICVSGVGIHGYIPIPHPRQPAPAAGSRNVFPYGTCTWWADQRYFQLHGVFVPWRTQANAWQWVARAHQFHWRISSRPFPGAIVILQPWVQGASGMGHVAVVERILKNGHVIVSNMSWGRSPWRVTYVQLAPGPGVTFIMR